VKMVDFNVDVNGAFEPEPQETDPVIRVAEALAADYLTTFMDYVRRKQAERKDRPVVQLWAPYRCKKLGAKK
jgi:hypothetical protein